ncbi:hypothetical protein NHH03_18720 [Stieleria sp. TO1_6]|uniref:hypothetical protein n=1 Tax=Stieleria tagensis TaxID=2956795 RepID=UPI00209A8233|nr:hypothetical protein [Stieleria tagensis]MCO8123785.1 hypothetical protein [Stieleria tagensis]
MPLVRDLAALLALQCLLLIATLAIGPGNMADIRVQLAWTGFLLLGWTIAPRWIGNHTSWLRRYWAAALTSIAVHGWIVAVGGWIGISMNAYLMLWAAAIVMGMIDRWRVLRHRLLPQIRFPAAHGWIVLALVLFVVCVYRTPRSNDIHQFMLQQQDMLAQQTLRVTTIGMSAMGVDQVMPRWNAHYWHLVPCLLAHCSGVAVDQVLLRYATIPVAMTVLLCLLESIRSLTRRRASYAVVLLAILGPVVLWYRNYTAFNYSFRITNNLLLDKDFALFFLLPSVACLTAGWIRGRSRYLIPLLGLFPAIVRFHPLTAVYLLLLAIPVLVLAMPQDRRQCRRAAGALAAALGLFVMVIAIGDAQSNHQQIQDIIRLDYDQSLEGRPLHYWVGFYNTIAGSGLPSDTTAWTAGRLHLKKSLLLGCGLLAMLPVALIAIAIRWVGCAHGPGLGRVFVSGLISLLMLGGMWWVSAEFLTRFPHYTAGYERLHWFAYPIALTVVAMMFAIWIPRRIRRVVGLGILWWIVFAAGMARFERRSPLVLVRGLNSMLDAESDAMQLRRKESDLVSWRRTLADMRPDYLNHDDRVLLLDGETTRHYWLIRQGVFWSDPYVEAFAWFHRGDGFLADRRRVYGLMDRVDVAEVRQWISDKGISIVVDGRDGADAFINRWEQEHGVQLHPVRPGVWRIR